MPATLNLEQLRSFLTIAETGSFGRAARAVEKTQAALSFQMRLLEDRVGKPVFLRGSAGSRLTEEGTRLVLYARRIVYLAEEAAAAFGDSVPPPLVTFAMPDDYAASYLQPILERFQRACVGVEVAVLCAVSPRIVEMAWAGEIDIGLVTNRCPTEVDVVHKEPLVWVASKNHSVENNEILPLAMSEQDCSWRKAALESLAAVGRRARVAFVSTNASAIAAVVEAGLAVSVLSAATVRKNMKVIGKAEGLPDLPSNELGLVRPWNRALSAPVRTLADTVRAVFREQRSQ